MKTVKMQINYTLMFSIIFATNGSQYFYFYILLWKVHMISNKQTLAIAGIAVLVLAVAGPILADILAQQAQARGFGFGGFRGGFGRGFGFGGFGGGFGGWGGGCGCCGCGCGGGGWGGW
jgi:hypothetical protein